MLDSGLTPEAFSFYQSEEMMVLSGWNLLFKIHDIVKKNKYGSQKNRGHKRLA